MRGEMGAFLIASLSMVGIPPTCGFFSKWYLVLGCIEAKNWVFAGIILVSSLLSAAYFFRILERVYFAPLRLENNSRERELPFQMFLPILILASGIILLGIFNAPIVSHLLKPAVNSVFP